MLCAVTKFCCGPGISDAENFLVAAAYLSGGCVNRTTKFAVSAWISGSEMIQWNLQHSHCNFASVLMVQPSRKLNRSLVLIRPFLVGQLEVWKRQPHPACYLCCGQPDRICCVVFPLNTSGLGLTWLTISGTGSEISTQIHSLTYADRRCDKKTSHRYFPFLCQTHSLHCSQNKFRHVFIPHREHSIFIACRSGTWYYCNVQGKM